MSKKLMNCAGFFLFLTLVWSCAGEAKSTPETLSADAQKVVDYLLKDWEQQFHSTSIALAMENLGMEPNDALRLEIGRYFRANTDLANNLKWWGPNNYLLSNDEKIIAKYLIHVKHDQGGMPDLAATAAATGLPEDNLNARLAFLVKAGLLVKSAEEKLGYALAEDYEKWGGPLRFNFHTVAIADEKSFDVW